MPVAARALGDSAVHRAMRWGAACLDAGGALALLRKRWALRGVPLNIGRIEGGIKPNMIAERCEVRFGLRTLPGQDGRALMEALEALAPAEELESFRITFDAPSLPAPESQATRPVRWPRELGPGGGGGRSISGPKRRCLAQPA